MLRYRIVTTKNPATKEILYYPAPVTDATSMETLCDNISQKTTLTRSDVHAGLCAFEEIIARHLQNGENVNLGAMGIFKARIRNRHTRPAEDIKKLTVADIKAVTTGYRPSMRMRSLMLDCSLEKSSKKGS